MQANAYDVTGFLQGSKRNLLTWNEFDNRDLHYLIHCDMEKPLNWKDFEQNIIFLNINW